jgi:hypothetical protein
METTRWTNPSLPQTLQSAVILLYITAVFRLLFGGLGLYSLVFGAAYAFGGWGIANERKVGYQVAVGAALTPFILITLFAGPAALIPSTFNGIIALAFPVLLVVLLLHPMSRGYQRIWFS